MSTERIRELYSTAARWDAESRYRDQFAAEFDAWLAAHDAKVFSAGFYDGIASASRAVATLGGGWAAVDDREPYWLITKTEAMRAIDSVINAEVTS
jgi:hypothetical protein